jgi:hypothetical protein
LGLKITLIKHLNWNVFPSGTTTDTTPVLEVVLKSMPIPDDQTPWQDIIEGGGGVVRIKLRVGQVELAVDQLGGELERDGTSSGGRR